MEKTLEERTSTEIERRKLEIKRTLDENHLGGMLEILQGQGFSKEEVGRGILFSGLRHPWENTVGGYLIAEGADAEEKIRWADEDRAYGRETLAKSLEKYEEKRRTIDQLDEAWRAGKPGPIKEYLLRQQEEALEVMGGPFVTDFLPKEAQDGRISMAAEMFIRAGVNYLITSHLLKEIAKKEAGTSK